MAEGGVPDDCTRCGACCFSTSPSYIAVFGIDRERMDERALALTVMRDGARFMRFAAGRCAALVDAGDESGPRLICGIYPMRPDACRWLERGSGVCREILATSRR